MRGFSGCDVDHSGAAQGSRLASMRSDTREKSTTCDGRGPTLPPCPAVDLAVSCCECRRVAPEESPCRPMNACTACRARLEAVQKFTDDPDRVPRVRGRRYRKVYGAVGIVLKGSGFYKTDSRAASGANRTRKKASEAQSGDGSTGDSSTKESSASDSGWLGQGSPHVAARGRAAPARTPRRPRARPAERLVVPSHQVGSRRLTGGSPPSAL